MKEADSFSGWDFWGIGDAGFQATWFLPADGYPDLAWLALETIPNVNGLPLEEACNLIEKAGFDIGGISADYDHVVPYGYAVATYPYCRAPFHATIGVIQSLGAHVWCSNPGAGDVNDPYLIVSPGQVDCLAFQADLWGRNFRIMSDLDMASRIYSRSLLGRSGPNGLTFDGTLDGGGHLIKHLTIEADAAEGEDAEMLGLFGEIGASGRIADLGLTRAWIKASGDRQVTAGMLSAVNAGRIERCYASGVLQGSGRLGGLAGSNAGTVENCYAMGEVRDLWGGGHAGLCGGLVAENRGGTIRTCYAACLVVSLLPAGLVAENAGGSVEHCLWDIEVSGTQASGAGEGLRTRELMDPYVLRNKGWGGNPNWVVDNGKDYPRLLWEGLPGSLIP
jgi:hypothetical protein